MVAACGVLCLLLQPNANTDALPRLIRVVSIMRIPLLLASTPVALRRLSRTSWNASADPAILVRMLLLELLRRKRIVRVGVL